MESTTSELTRVEDDPNVVKAQHQLFSATKELEIATSNYQQTHRLATGQSSATMQERQQAIVDLPEMKRQWEKAKLNVHAPDDAWQQAKRQAIADRVPILKERLKMLVRERQATGEGLVPLNEAILALWEEANHVLGGSQREIPNLSWPEFREDGMLAFRTKPYQQAGWL